MQKILITALAVILFSCHAEDKKEADTKSASKTEPAANLPYTATYSSKFEMGDPKHVETIMKLWKSWDDGDLSKDSSLFADTIYIYTRDGSKSEGPRDSVNAGAQAYRNMFSSVKSTMHAIFPVKSTDKNENWVCVWGTEVSIDKQGKKDSVSLQETWRFNKAGKVDLLYQHGMPLMPASAPK
ncbi:MAG: hypothetical protein JNN00_18915 [Chitinophagaceae bacterium]|nr:hypothetical protein [Chitinophagaceae bacterium]